MTSFGESSIEILFAVWCQRENFLKVKDELHERIRNGFVDNHIEIPVPKMGFVDRPIPSVSKTLADVDEYAQQEQIKL